MTANSSSQRPADEREHLLSLLREMIRIRRFEEKCAELYTLNKIHGFLHLYVGEEAIAVGAIPLLRPDDAIVSTYREHGHALARGVPAGVVMAEMFGKASGCSRGRGGSMHLFDAKRRFYGGHAIVGGGLPIAVGLALAEKMQGKRSVTACFLGDGAVAEGEFHESLNLAALWQLPVLFICENNLYAMGTALTRHQSQPDIRLKAQSYAMEAEQIDGMDVLAVEAAARHAIDKVRSSGAPFFIEARTYRFRAHSMYDAELYRDKSEVDQWKQRDPITGLATQLRQDALLNDTELQRIESSIETEVEIAVAFAEASQWEPIEDLLRDVLTPTLPP